MVGVSTFEKSRFARTRHGERLRHEKEAVGQGGTFSLILIAFLLQCFLFQIVAIKEAGVADPFVKTLVGTINQEAVGQGVYTEDDLVERFQKVWTKILHFSIPNISLFRLKKSANVQL